MLLRPAVYNKLILSRYCRRYIPHSLSPPSKVYRLYIERTMASVHHKATMPAENPHAKDKLLVWVDLEMSGLEVETHVIVEMACILTDEELNIVAESPSLVINYPQLRFSDWCQVNFAKSGLLREIAESEISLPAAEDIMLNFLQQHVNPKTCPLAGNSVHMDRSFLRKYMPKFEEYLHYRIVDVSTVKELARRWYPTIFQQQPTKAFTHRALQDIKESIAELRFYRNHIFVRTETPT